MQATGDICNIGNLLLNVQPVLPRVQAQLGPMQAAQHMLLENKLRLHGQICACADMFDMHICGILRQPLCCATLSA